MFRRVAGRPVLPRMDLPAWRQPMMSRCQRRIVSWVISSRSPWRRAFGITLSRAASRARSAQFSFGRRGCCRCNTASWWRRIKISAIFHASSRRDTRSHATTRVISRNTNRRHMIGDHHGRVTGRATLLVRAVDGIPGTHRRLTPLPSCAARASRCSRVPRGWWFGPGLVTERGRASVGKRAVPPVRQRAAWRWVLVAARSVRIKHPLRRVAGRSPSATRAGRPADRAWSRRHPAAHPLILGE
jgi:hypothetical protein